MLGARPKQDQLAPRQDQAGGDQRGNLEDGVYMAVGKHAAILPPRT